MMFLAELFALSFASLVVAQDTNLRTVVNTFNQFNVSIVIGICNGLLHISMKPVLPGYEGYRYSI